MLKGKKILLGVIFCVLSQTAFAFDTYTEQLQDKYADGNIHIEYTFVREKNQNTTTYDRESKRHKKGAEIIKESNTANNQLIELGKYCYVQKGENLYYRHDYPIYKDDILPELGVLNYTNQRTFKDNEKQQYSGSSIVSAIAGVMGAYGSGKVGDDLNILTDNKIYFLDRAKKEGVWCDINELEYNKKASQYMLNSKLIGPSAIRDIILAKTSKYQNKYIKTRQENMGDISYVVETYLIQAADTYGNVYSDLMNVDLYYNNGILEILSSNYIIQGLSEEERKSFPKEYYKVDVLQKSNDGFDFSISSEYKLKPMSKG